LVADIILIVGLALLLQGGLLYWAYGVPTAFDPDGTPKGFVAAGRPAMVADISRFFRVFSYGATVLIGLGLAAIALSLVS